MAPTVAAVINHKGGSGKTTTVVNVAAALGEGGRRALVVDLDAQGSATRWLADSLDDRLLEVFERARPTSEFVRATGLRRRVLAWRVAGRTRLAREGGQVRDVEGPQAQP